MSEYKFASSFLETPSFQAVETSDGPRQILTCACPVCHLRQTTEVSQRSFESGFAITCQNGEKCGAGDTLLVFPEPGRLGHAKYNLKESPDDPPSFIPTDDDPPA